MANTAGMSWQEYLGDVFPGYLLPAAMHHAIDVRTAQRFLSRLDPRPDLLDLLLRSSLIAGHGDHLRSFCDALAELVRVLPSRTHVEQRIQDGGFHGRLAIPDTMMQRAAGMPTRFVTRTRRRAFDLPENELVHFVARRLLVIMASLRKHDLLPKDRPGTPTPAPKPNSKRKRTSFSDRPRKHDLPWKQDALACETELNSLLLKSVLSEVPELESLTPYHEQATLAALHPCYQEAHAWYRRMNETMDEVDQRRLAEVLAQGALRPLSPHDQFEIAVLIRLVEAIEDACVPNGWSFERSIVMQGRKSVARFHRDGASIEVFYNQATVLPPAGAAPGPRDAGLGHYFANKGQFRPDITVLVQRPGQRPRGVVLEVKNSSDKGYLRGGYQEALMYRYEYADHLIQWPKAVLVCSSAVPGAVSRRHDVVAVDWQRWVPKAIVEAIVPAT
jgi:hypothetical protein